MVWAYRKYNCDDCLWEFEENSHKPTYKTCPKCNKRFKCIRAIEYFVANKED